MSLEAVVTLKMLFAFIGGWLLGFVAGFCFFSTDCSCSTEDETGK